MQPMPAECFYCRAPFEGDRANLGGWWLYEDGGEVLTGYPATIVCPDCSLEHSGLDVLHDIEGEYQVEVKPEYQEAVDHLADDGVE